ncbi:MAG TPA: response regulator transcription factor [Terriglobia bacterium]|nr:response regulator transcription factor [Terriglobia bacterium]
MRILVVEDEQKVARALQEGLQDEGFSVVLAFSGEDAFFRIHTEDFDVIVLDLMLPGRDGFEVLSAVRQRGVKTPVLLLTARDTLEDRDRGWRQGADDYLAKPFAFDELVSRIRILLRRGHSTDGPRLGIADLDMNLVTRRVTRAGRMIDLTAREFAVLEYFLRRQGQLVRRDSLASDVWNETMRGTPLNNVIDVHIARLRRKIDSDGSGKLIHTVRGMGFMISDRAATEST